MNKSYTPLPSDWMPIAETDINNGEATFEVVQGESPKWSMLYNDWIIPMRCVVSTDYHRSNGITDGDICGYAFYHKSLT